MATVQSYTKAGVDQKLADRSYRVLPHPGGGTPNLASYPDAKSGDVIERNSDGARWSVLAGTLNPETGRVVSVAGKTGIVTLGPTDVGAAPTSHTHTKAQITDLNASTAATANSIAQRTTNGRLVVGTPTSSTDAATKAYVDSAATNASKWSSITGKPGTVSDTINTTNAGAYLVLNSGGRISAGTPTQDSDVANKAYVDSKTWTIGNISDLNVSTSATVNTVAQRTTGGRLIVGAPTSGSDATTKAYVDAAVTESKAWANLTGKPSTYPPSTHNHTVSQIRDLTLNASAVANTVPIRNASGVFSVAEPTSDSHAASRGYVNAAISEGTKWDNISDKPPTFQPISHTHSLAQIRDLTVAVADDPETVVKRDNLGRVNVSEPAWDSHAATKKYVDDKVGTPVTWANISGKPSTFPPATHTHTIAQITDLTISTSATANTVAQRTTGGRLVVGTPSATSEATTKAYVDSAVTAAKAWANLTGKPSTYPPSTHNHTVSQIRDLTLNASAVANTVPIRNASGVFSVAEPTSDSHAASRGYVNAAITDHTHTSSQISDRLTGVWSTNATDGLVVATSGGGYIQTSKIPVTGIDVANKKYVDGRPALFKGASLPPSSIPGALVGDSWLDTRNMRLYNITGV